MSVRSISAVLVATATVAACGGIRVPKSGAPPAAAILAQLWIEPGDAPRDLYWGSGGRAYAPDPQATFALGSRDDSGFSVSYDVTGPDEVEWSAKIGPEAQSEVVLSRLLWGVGYHQPPLYYLPSWRLDGGRGEIREESEARFRPKIREIAPKGTFWTWTDNPFVGAREFRGLLVILLMLNSTDLKNDNNSIYELSPPREGASTWFLVRDLGAALGETGKLYPRRNWLEGFERSGFINGVAGNRVLFDYRGRHQELLDMITPADVRWAAERLNRLSDSQWRDAFRAANYADPIARRYITRIKERIAQGLALTSTPQQTTR